MNNKADKIVIGAEFCNDCNTIERTGIFSCGGATMNTPPSASRQGMIITSVTYNNDKGYQAQMFVSNINGKLYTRSKWQGNWSSWVEK